jgi:hypothetical protein
LEKIARSFFLSDKNIEIACSESGAHHPMLRFADNAPKVQQAVEAFSANAIDTVRIYL